MVVVMKGLVGVVMEAGTCGCVVCRWWGTVVASVFW